MRQKVNGIHVLARLVEHPSLDKVLEAELFEEPLEITVVTYALGHETLAQISLGNIRRVRFLPDDLATYSFVGNSQMLIAQGLPDEDGCIVAVEARGIYYVKVEQESADLGFLCHHSFMVAPRLYPHPG